MSLSECSVSRRAIWVLATTSLLAACATRPAQSIPIAVLVEAPVASAESVGKSRTASMQDAAGGAQVKAQRGGGVEDGKSVGGRALGARVEGLALHAVVLPAPLPAPRDETSAPLARARKAYAAGELEACRAEIAKLDVASMLAAGARDAAARALALDAACAWGMQATTVARAIAARLAAYGLALPDAGISPDIEAVIGDAIVAAGNARAREVRVRGEAGARLRVDGRAPACALPCRVDLVPGEHVLAVSADGRADAHRAIRVPDVVEVEIAQTAASPALAVTQWRARAGLGLPATDDVGARLIAQLAGERRVAVLAERRFDHQRSQLDGALIIDGVVAARAKASGGDVAGVLRELAYDAGVLHRPSVVQRPWFWIAVSGATLAIAATITVIVYQPSQRTSLSL